MNFFKNIFSSCLGTLLAMAILVVLMIGIGSAIGSLSQGPTISSNSVLHLSLPDLVPERTNNLPMGMELILEDNIWGIHDIGYSIQKAATDSKIKALLIETGPTRSFEHMDILRRSMKQFQKSGKPIYAYGDYFNQSNYYLASSADKIFLNPLGQVELKGFAVVEPFMKDALDDIGIEMEVYYAGDFKSATEPFRRNSMSEQNRTQLREFINELYEQYLDTLSVSRGISKNDLKRIANSYGSRNSADAIRLGLVDQIGYDSDLADDLKSELGLNEDDMLKLVDVSAYRTATGKKRNYSAKDKIAVVYMEGEFRGGDNEEGSISAKRYVPLMRKIRRDESIDAVVIRVNSPGGNAIIADKILAEIRRIKAVGKPVVTSMGDLAASGGYYVAALSDSIFASRQTITGSIGVFSMFPNFHKLVDSKMGIKLDSVSTSPYAGMGNLLMPRSEKEKEVFQNSTDSMYLTFLDIVAEGRRMSRDDVHEVAQGRIWTGSRALEHALIDKIGDLPDAIDCAAGLAETNDYRVVEYPEIKTPIERISDELNNMGDLDRKIEMLSPTISSYHRLIKDSKHVQAWMPYSIIFN